MLIQEQAKTGGDELEAESLADAMDWVAAAIASSDSDFGRDVWKLIWMMGQNYATAVWAKLPPVQRESVNIWILAARK